jgi:diguanylate cyclase (GGDEF)-like protein
MPLRLPARLAPPDRLGRMSAVMVLVLLLGLLPTAGLLWSVAEGAREDAKQEALQRLGQAAQFTAGLQADAIAAVRRTLELAAEQPLDWAEDPQRCIAHSAAMAARHPFIASFAVLRLDGTVTCTGHGQGHGVSLADRPYIIAALGPERFGLGAPLNSRTRPGVVLPMAQQAAVLGPGANPPALVGATLDLARVSQGFTATLTNEARAADAQMRVYDAVGRLLAAYPPGQDAQPSPPLDPQWLIGPRGTFEYRDESGRNRLVGYAHATQGGTIYAATLLTDVMLGRAEARLRRVHLLGVMAALLGLAAALQIARVRILRPLSLLTEVATKAGGAARSAMPARRLPGEFDVLRQAMGALLEDVASREKRLHEANVELARLADRDALTGIPNRRSFNAALAEAWARGLAEEEHVALVILDVDHFKKFNDRYGHLPGDGCLCKVAAAIDSVRLRERDLVARLGGEEFVMLLPRTDSTGAMVVAERALEAIRARMMLHEDGLDGMVTASAGVAACVPIRGMDPLALLAAADAALYAAKQTGRNRAVAARSLGVSTAASAHPREAA